MVQPSVKASNSGRIQPIARLRSGKGEKGDTGATGDTGAKGDTGDTGAKGDQGDPGDMTNPMTAEGDIIYGGVSGAPTKLVKGTAEQVLKMNAGETAPEWGAAGADVLEIQVFS